MIVARRFFQTSRLVKNVSETSKKIPSKDELVGNFGKFFSDNMAVCDYENGEWGDPRIEPFANISISPAASSLHYALQCFEGMKVYRKAYNQVILFRPELNAARLNASLRRLAMPEIDEQGFVEFIVNLIAVDEKWIPDGDGYAAYLRPTVIATDPVLGVHAPQSCKFYTLLSPVGPYFPNGFDPITVFADTVNVRAWRGGVGGNKVGANYGPTVKPQKDAHEEYGTQQVLYCPDGRVTEVGSMNVFAVVDDELWTPSLDHNDILPGVTRRSIVELAPTLGLQAIEKDFSLFDLRKASSKGRLKEFFGSGTGASVCPISAIVTGPDESIKLGEEAGDFTKQFGSRLADIQYGRDPNFADWIVPVVTHVDN